MYHVWLYQLLLICPFNSNYYSFEVSLDKCYASCSNIFDDLPTKVCVPSITKEVNIKVFHMITTINDTKTLEIIFHVIICKFESKACNSNQKWKNETSQWEY